VLAAAEPDGMFTHPGGAPTLRPASPIRLVQIHHYDEGKPLQSLFTAADLASGTVRVSGYITGIVVLCAEGTAVSLDGRRMDPIVMGPDKTVRIRNRGQMRLDQLFPAGAPLPSGAASSPLPGAFAYFPAVAGDAVSPEVQVVLRFGSGNRPLVAVLEQTGYTDLCEITPDTAVGRAPVHFSHAGSPRSELACDPANLADRTRAIARGIGSVETEFAPGLIEGVTIIDTADQYNAVTCNGRRRIWFYRSAFLQEPIAELSVIAEHESLHIVTDLLQLTSRTEVRELFADLKGYDTLSRERLELVIRGWSSSQAPREDNPRALFFQFIREGNFIEGMKGGHPQADPEEFCASFLHSLMYVDRFQAALSRPIGLPGSTPRALTLSEKRAITDDYLRALDVFEESIRQTASPDPASAAARAAARLSERMAQVRAEIRTEPR
jgi:hypothetical protein